jgi:FMN-dependent NADH-azoreductase
MSKLLVVNSSPRGPKSESLALAETFLASYREANPGAEIERLDLFTADLPVFDGDKTAAKMQVFAGAEPDVTAWGQVRAVFERFDSADRYLFTVPMWNHGVTWPLKHFIDTITQPGMAFSFDPVDGYRGLVRNKRTVAIYTGAVYGPGVPASFGHDFHSAFFEDWLRFIGITDVHAVRFQRNLTGPTIEADRVAAHARAAQLGATLFDAAALAAAA